MTGNGGVAQMVERSLSMREVLGSIPGASKPFISRDIASVGAVGSFAPMVFEKSQKNT